MDDSTFSERPTPLDVLRPGTYVSTLLTFRTTEYASSLLPDLQQSLSSLSSLLPWIKGLVLPTTGSNGKAGLQVRWNSESRAPQIIDKGSLALSYGSLVEGGMTSSAIPADVWLLSSMIDDTQFSAGTPVFDASIFQFADHQAVCLCVSMHHNAIDATIFAETLLLWTRVITRNDGVSQSTLGLDRLDRLSKSLSLASCLTTTQSSEEILALHPELSKAPPAMPLEFPLRITKILRILIARIRASKRVVEHLLPTLLTTNTVVCALLWSSVTRVRVKRQPALADQTSHLAMAVNGR